MEIAHFLVDLPRKNEVTPLGPDLVDFFFLGSTFIIVGRVPPGPIGPAPPARNPGCIGGGGGPFMGLTPGRCPPGGPIPDGRRPG
jgi:hypothetical protein